MNLSEKNLNDLAEQRGWELGYEEGKEDGKRENMAAFGETEKRNAATEMGIAEDQVFLKTKDDAGFANTLYMSPEAAREMGRYLVGLADLVDPPVKKPVTRAGCRDGSKADSVDTRGPSKAATARFYNNDGKPVEKNDAV